MSVQKEPLTPKQLAELENKARSIGGDTYKVFMILRYTGQHVSVINTGRFNLHEEIDEDGDTILVWYRPKKNGKIARTSIPKHKNIDFNVEKFGVEVQKRRNKRSRQYLYDLIRRLGIEAGIANISPMSFRHSLAIELLNNGASEIFVSQVLNCSRETLKWYGKYTDHGKIEQFRRMGWL